MDDTDALTADLGLDFDLVRLEWYRRRFMGGDPQHLREIGESGLRRLFAAGEISAEEFEDLFGALLRAASPR